MPGGEPEDQCPWCRYNFGANVLSLSNHQCKGSRCPNDIDARKRFRAEKGQCQPSSVVFTSPVMLPHPAFSLCPLCTLWSRIMPEIDASTQILPLVTPTTLHLKLLAKVKKSQVISRKPSLVTGRKVRKILMLRPLAQQMKKTTHQKSPWPTLINHVCPTVIVSKLICSTLSTNIAWTLYFTMRLLHLSRNTALTDSSTFPAIT